MELILVGFSFIYGCFFTDSSAFRTATRMSFLVFACALIGTTALAFLSAPVRENIQQFQSVKREGYKIYLDSEETMNANADTSNSAERSEYQESEAETGAHLPLADFNIEPFYAVHFVPPENESIVRFSADGADLTGATPFERPSIYPLNHITVDPSGPYFYGVTTHRFGKIDSQTGEFHEIHIHDKSIPQLSWPGGIAFDTRRQRILITSRGHLYSYYPGTNYWETLADTKAIPIVYSPEEDLLYGLESGGKKIKKINMRGAVVGELHLSQKVPAANTWEKIKVQILWSSNKILILSSKDSMQIYIIDPLTGEVIDSK